MQFVCKLSLCQKLFTKGKRGTQRTYQAE